ncbi:MAG: ATP-binding protein [Candidatus Sericytochromatia bacterium]
MQKTDQPKEINLTIPIIPDMEVAATNTAEAVLRFMAFDTDKIDEVKHALIEGCINAFEHSQSQDGNVYIKFVMQEDELVVIIQDFGHGFEVETVEKPELDQKLGVAGSYKRGWGLMMMESLMDTVSIDSNQSGTRITMTKKRT